MNKNKQFFSKLEWIKPKNITAEIKTLYKYLPFESLVEILKHGDLKITSRADANDPYEMLPWGETPTENIKNYDEYGVISFSENNNIPSLWGNYADKYKGVCIEVQIPCFTGKCEISSQLKYFIKTNKEEKRNVKIISFYKNPADNESLIGLGNSCVLAKTIYSKKPRAKKAALGETLIPIIQPFINKDKTWEHEKEWRVITSKDHASRSSFFNKTQMYFSDSITKYITKIIIGPYCEHTKESLKIFIPHIIESHGKKTSFNENIEIIKAEFSKTTFLLDIPWGNTTFELIPIASKHSLTDNNPL